MSAYNLQKTEVRWDQSGFEALKATWSAARIEQDEKRLKNIFNLASQSPTLKLALEWADRHGVQFFIYRQAINCGGYYTPGTVVVALAGNATNSISYAVQAITHEIRHAWQDYHGLCPTDFPGPATTPDFAGYFIQLSLIEADATALGKRAEAEFRTVMFPLLGSSSPPASPANESAHLRKRFMDWFSSARTTNYYGDAASKSYARDAGIYNGALPKRNFEFTTKIPPLGAGVDITCVEGILKLGKTFSGRNYLARLPREVWSKKILSPTLAMSFYKAANDNKKKLVAEIRKYCLRQKLSLHP